MARRPRRFGPRYHVAPKGERTWRGVTYDSKGEMQYAQWLETLRSGGEIVSIERQPRVCLADAVKYRADWLVEYRDGRREYIDFKGHESDRFRVVKQLWKVHGPLPLRLVARNGSGFQTTEVIGEQSDV